MENVICRGFDNGVPRKGCVCDEALAVAIYALISLVTLVVTVVMAVLIWLTITGELSLILLS